MTDKKLYFIALLPPVELQDEITVFKKDFASRFNSSRALRVMPHITLQSPFRRGEEIEAPLIGCLDAFSRKHRSFDVQLNGFGCFTSKINKVVFVDVVQNEALRSLHKELALTLRSEMKFPIRETTLRFHPHVTVAYRDLSDAQFEKAWEEYKDKKYNTSWKVHSTILSKQSQKTWEVLTEFRLY